MRDNRYDPEYSGSLDDRYKINPDAGQVVDGIDKRGFDQDEDVLESLFDN